MARTPVETYLKNAKCPDCAGTDLVARYCDATNRCVTVSLPGTRPKRQPDPHWHIVCTNSKCKSFWIKRLPETPATKPAEAAQVEAVPTEAPKRKRGRPRKEQPVASA